MRFLWQAENTLGGFSIPHSRGTISVTYLLCGLTGLDIQIRWLDCGETFLSSCSVQEQRRPVFIGCVAFSSVKRLIWMGVTRVSNQRIKSSLFRTAFWPFPIDQVRLREYELHNRRRLAICNDWCNSISITAYYVIGTTQHLRFHSRDAVCL